MKINSGPDPNRIYGSYELPSQDSACLESAGRCQNNPSGIDWANGYNRDRACDGDNYRTHGDRGHEGGRIGDPQVAAEIRHLLQELENVLKGSRRFTSHAVPERLPLRPRFQEP